MDSGVARASLNEAEVLVERGEFDRAEELLGVTLRHFRATGYPLGVAMATVNRGRVLAQRGDFDAAQRTLAEAEGLLVELGNPGFAAGVRARQAQAHILAGEHREALEIAIALRAEIEGAQAGKTLAATLERVIGYALVQGRRKEEAEEHFERSLEIARGLDADFEIALTLKAMADTGLAGANVAAEAQAILERLGVVSVPRVPLP
jgi:tetratricopeptide (TPR) repeat protein